LRPLRTARFMACGVLRGTMETRDQAIAALSAEAARLIARSRELAARAQARAAHASERQAWRALSKAALVQAELRDAARRNAVAFLQLPKLEAALAEARALVRDVEQALPD
jgi:hypothetical protein